MCNAPKPAMRSAVLHDGGAKTAMAPSTVKHAPITGTTRTEKVPPVITPAP